MAVLSKMRYHIYNCIEWSEDDDFMSYVGVVECAGGKDERIRTVVGWLLGQVLKRSVYIPYFVEVSIQEHFKKEKDLKIPEAFIDEIDEVAFKEAIDRILASEYLMKTFYMRWTEEEELPLVIVSEGDVAAEFILKRFPPIEYYAHVREKWDGEDGEEGEDSEGEGEEEE
jgi:hypothetical protein